jgi:predicted unusual protein kinase regulating ubiquinone biosynthesis (AarF/ABC1/UbiB family)
MAKVPTSRFSRFAKLAGVGLRTGAGMLLKREGDGAGAKHAAEVLGSLRGLAAKVGQMGSYVDGFMPEEHKETYERALAVLRSQAPQSSFADVRATIERELGKSLTELFTEFSEAPIASASIGQVHRAVFRDGRVVAVKVQHTQIREAVESDLMNGSVLASMAELGLGRRYDVKSHLDVVKQRFREELDYRLEAERQDAFRSFHHGDPSIVIPAVIREASSESVLTTEFASGISFDDAVLASEAERIAWAETLWRFVFRTTLMGRMFNADPHPGNYFFGIDGKVTFVDFGCIQPISESRQPYSIAAHQAAAAGDTKGFDDAVAVLIGAKPGPLRDVATAYTRRCFDPLFCSPFRITRSWAGNLVHGMKELGKASKASDDEAFFNPPPELLFMNRLQFGFYSVLARLDVEVDYAAVERAFLPQS